MKTLGAPEESGAFDPAIAVAISQPSRMLVDVIRPARARSVVPEAVESSLDDVSYRLMGSEGEPWAKESVR
jgi:hypothetical protein